jgi:hypothetical protein
MALENFYRAPEFSNLVLKKYLFNILSSLIEISITFSEITSTVYGFVVCVFSVSRVSLYQNNKHDIINVCTIAS